MGNGTKRFLADCHLAEAWVLAAESLALTDSPAARLCMYQARTQAWLPAGKLGNLDGEYISVAFSPDGALLALGGMYGNLELWDVAEHRLLAVLVVPKEPEPENESWDDWERDGDKSGLPCTSLAFSSDGAILASTTRLRTRFDGETPSAWQENSIGQDACQCKPRSCD